MPHASPLPPAVPVSAHEWRWLALAVVLGAAIRLMYLDRVAVEHFDEGVYAANVWFGAEEGYQYPLRQFYAPPLLPALIEWCYVFWGMTGLTPPAWLPMVPSLLCGIATIPSAWWIARRWFGPTAGYAAMWLVALNEFHAAYSRTALTDVPVTLAILWAVFAAWKLLLHPTVKNGVVTGLLTAIAWWLKYSGWLPFAILLVGGAVFQCLVRPEERRWKAWGIATTVAVLTAGLLWLPVLSDCQAVGGYSAVAANHRGYIMGWSSWWANFVTQAENFGTYPTLTAYGLMIVMNLHGYRDWKWPALSKVFGLFFVLPMWLSFAAPGWLWPLFLLAAGVAIIDGLRGWKHTELPLGQVAAAAALSTWFCGLFVATPLYQPYSRLLMPWWLATGLLAAWCLQRVSRFTPPPAGNVVLPTGQTAESGLASFGLRHDLFMFALVTGGVVLMTQMPQHRTWEDRREYRTAAVTIATEMKPRSDTAIVQVYGLPSVVLALRERGVAAVVCGGPEAAARLDGSWLVVSSDADRDSTWNDHWSIVADRFELVRTIDIHPSSIVRLDNGPLPSDPPPVAVRLYRHR